MAEEEAGTGGGGDGGGEGAAAGQEGESQGAVGTPAAPTSIPLEVLPEQLRSRPPAELKFLLDNMVTSVHNTAEENRRLKEELASRAAPKEPAAPKQPERPLEERILEDPEGTIAEVIDKRYGNRFREYDEGMGESVFGALRASHPDFREYEDDVREALRQGNLPVNRANVTGAYLMAVGKKSIESKRQAATSTGAAGKSRAKEEKPAKEPALSELEKEIAGGLGLSADEYSTAKKQWKDGSFNIQVPTGKSKAREEAKK